MTINYCCYVVTAWNLTRTMSNDGFGTSSIRHLGSTTSVYSMITIRHFGSTTSVYSMITKMIISPSSLLLPSPPPTLVPIINKRMKVYDMKQVFTEITRERYHQDNSLTIPIVLYLCVCFTAGYAKRWSWPTNSGVDTAPQIPRRGSPRGSGACQTYRTLTFVLVLSDRIPLSWQKTLLWEIWE